MEYTKEQWKIYAAFLKLVSGKSDGPEWIQQTTVTGKDITDVSQLPMKRQGMDFNTGRWNEY